MTLLKPLSSLAVESPSVFRIVPNCVLKFRRQYPMAWLIVACEKLVKCQSIPGLERLLLIPGAFESSWCPAQSPLLLRDPRF